MTNNIYPAISGIMSEIGAISKSKTNTQQGFKYRGVDDVMNALQPLLYKHKVFIVPEILEHVREDRTSSKGNALIYTVCKIKYTFYADDGSSVAAVVVGEGMDSGDKSTNKAMAIAFKYACFQVFCIPTEEMADPDAECHEVVNKPVKQKSEPKPQPQPNAEVICQSDMMTILAMAKNNKEVAKAAINKFGYTNVAEVKKVDLDKIIKYLQEESKNAQ